MVVVGAIVPLGFLLNTAAGLSYSLACKLANTVSDVASSNLQTYFRKGDGAAGDAASATGNGLQTLADNYGECLRQVEARRFAKQCEDLAAKKGTRLAEVFDRLMRDPVQKATVKAGMRVASPSLSKAAQEVIVADGKALAARAATFPKSGNAIENFKNAPTKGSKCLIAASRGVAIGVGIWFLWDDIKIAWEGKTAHDERTRREK
jgi:hypothetical protein